jgi:hypothetical protein
VESGVQGAESGIQREECGIQGVESKAGCPRALKILESP